MQPEIYIKEHCICGEGPLWNAVEKKLYFVDIRGKFFASAVDGKIEKTMLPQEIGCMTFASNGDLLLGLEDGVYRMPTTRDSLIKMYDAGAPFLGRRCNDGKSGPDGRFYFGTTDRSNQGAFYSLDKDGLHLLFDGVGCSNGLDWSRDEKTMYYCDTVTQTIEMFDFPGDGTLQNRRRLTVIPEEMGKPDGFIMDENDNLWVALWDGSRIICIDHETGKFIEEIQFPVSRPTCCTFIEEKLNWLVVTSAALETDPDIEPDAGSLFVVDVGVCGKKTYCYTY